MNITKNKAYKFFMEKMGDEKHITHCGAVINCCLGMVENTDLNKDIFIISGWIHDIGKLVDKPNHHIESLKFLDEFLELYSEYKEISGEVKDCIINHRTDGKPKTIYGSIFKCADKAALHDRKWLEYKKSKSLLVIDYFSAGFAVVDEEELTDERTVATNTG